MKKEVFAGFSILLLGMLACQPIFAIGWREIFIVFILAAIVFGPPVYRFFRRLENYRRQKDK
jgi:hypothetical protein